MLHFLRDYYYTFLLEKACNLYALQSQSLISKLLQILPKADRTRTYKGSLTGQLNIFIELSFLFIVYLDFEKFYNEELVLFFSFNSNNWITSTVNN